MACDNWLDKLDAYIDGELSAHEARALNEHIKQCASCGAEALRRVQQKRMVQAAAFKFKPDAAFRARVRKQIGSPTRTHWMARWIPVLVAVAAAFLIAAFLIASQRSRGNEQQLLGELIDQHVASLASATPVDVISTDRHTVKPWFAGRVPFTFNLPDLQNTPFTLIGGRVAYLKQSPGAELIFRVRLHQISVFIFQERAALDGNGKEGVHTNLSFQVNTWHRDGLRYFVVGDAGASDIEQLSKLMQAAE